MRARDQSSIFSTGGIFCPDLWAFIGVTRSYSSRRSYALLFASMALGNEASMREHVILAR